MKPRSILIPTIVAAVVAALALTLAGGSTTPAAAPPAGTVAPGKHLVITIQNYAFHPASVTVRSGTTVRVINRDQTQHTLTANDGAFDTGTIQPGQSKRLKLVRPGSFPYHCAFHAFMTGTLKVIS